MNRLRRVCMVAAVGCGLGGGAHAQDALKLKDGREFAGRVVSEVDGVVVFETRVRGMRMTARYPRETVASLARAEVAATTYYALPIKGSIGKREGPFVTAEMLSGALADVRQARPDYVVLVIDSPGGSLDEMTKIIEVIGEAKDLKFVAYVKRAISAAAIIALRCPTIIMEEGGTLGGAVPFKLGPDGTPRAVEEKFQSILRAEFRRAAELGGHSALAAQGMMDIDIELSLRQQGDRVEVVEGAGARTLKRRGEILTLTAREASAGGISVGTAPSVAGAAGLMGVKAWSAVDDKAWYEMMNAAEAEQWREGQERAAASKLTSWAEQTKGARAELATLAAEVDAAQARRDSAYAEAKKLMEAQKTELDELKKQWDAERVSIAGSSSNNSALSAGTRRRLADLDAIYAAKEKETKERTEGPLQAAVSKAKKADDEAKAAYNRYAELYRRLPPRPSVEQSSSPVAPK